MPRPRVSCNLHAARYAVEREQHPTWMVEDSRSDKRVTALKELSLISVDQWGTGHGGPGAGTFPGWMSVWVRWLRGRQRRQTWVIQGPRSRGPTSAKGH